MATITLWSGPQQYCVIQQAPVSTVTITGPGTFKLEAITSNGTPDDINLITVSGVVSSVVLYVTPDPNQTTTYGAGYVHTIDLSGAGTSTVAEVRAKYAVADQVGALRATRA
jgi:hypothetical protein